MKYGRATCLPHKGGGVPLSALPKDTTSKLAGLFFTLSLLYAERQAGKLWIPFFKVFWYDSTLGMNPTSTNYEADALTTTPSRRFFRRRNLLRLLSPVVRVKLLFRTSSMITRTMCLSGRNLSSLQVRPQCQTVSYAAVRSTNTAPAFFLASKESSMFCVSRTT